MLYPPRDRCCGPYTIAIVIGSVSSRVWQDIATEFNALATQCAGWEDMPVKDLEAFILQVKAKVTTWGKKKGALLSGQRVDQAAEGNKLIEKAKCLEKIAGALDAYQESYDVVRAKALLAAMAEAKDVAVSLPGICQVQELNALASLEWDGGNHANSSKRLAYKDLTLHVSDLCAKSVISSFVKRCVEQILQKADTRGLTVNEVTEELIPVVNCGEVVTIDMDSADNFCQDMKAFALHVQPEGAQCKEEIEQAVDRLSSSDLFRGLKVFDSGFALVKRAKEMVPKIEALHATTEEFKAWFAETSVAAQKGLVGDCVLDAGPSYACVLAKSKSWMLQVHQTSALRSLMVPPEDDLDVSIVAAVVGVRAGCLSSFVAECLKEFGNHVAALCKDEEGCLGTLATEITDGDAMRCGKVVDALPSQMQQRINSATAGEPEWLRSSCVHVGAKQIFEDEVKSWEYAVALVSALCSAFGTYSTMRVTSRAKGNVETEFTKLTDFIMRLESIDETDLGCPSARSLPCIKKTLKGNESLQKRFVDSVQQSLRAASLEQWQKVRLEVASSAVELSTSWTSIAKDTGRGTWDAVMPCTLRSLPPGQHGKQTLAELQAVTSAHEKMLEAAIGLAGIRGRIERHFVLLEMKLADFRKSACALLSALNVNGFEPHEAAGSGQLAPGEWCKLMAAPVANVRVSLAAWEALKCSEQLGGTNNGGLTGEQLERIEENRRLAMQKRLDGASVPSHCCRSWGDLDACFRSAQAFAEDVEMHCLASMVQVQTKASAAMESFFGLLGNSGDFMIVMSSQPKAKKIEDTLFWIEDDEGDIIDRAETARQQLTQCVEALTTIVNRSTLLLHPSDVGSPRGAWSEELEHWRSVETRAQLFLMAAASWDLMLCLEESTKKSRAAEAATLKDNLKQLPKVAAQFPGSLLSLVEAWVGGADIRAMCQ